MDVRERLIKICDTDFGYVDEVPAEKFADYLLANDVTLVKHGTWHDFLGDFTTAECDKCGEMLEVSPDEKANFVLFELFKQSYRYCPNCGARMDGDGS